MAVALALGAAPALAGHTGVGGVGGYPVFVPQLAPTPAPGVAATASTTTETAAQIMAEANRICAELGPFMVDCLAERLEQAARSMAPTGPTAEARAILESAARDMAALARGSADRTRTPGRVRAGDRVISTRPIVAVDPARQDETAAAAANIMQNAETLLLRSSTGSQARRAQYQRLAAVAGSTKVLLRST